MLFLICFKNLFYTMRTLAVCCSSDFYLGLLRWIFVIVGLLLRTTNKNTNDTVATTA